MTQVVMLTCTQQLLSSGTQLHLEGGEEVIEMHGPMQDHEVPHSLQGPLLHWEGGEEVPEMHGPMQDHEVPHQLLGPLQSNGATKEHYQGQERYVGKRKTFGTMMMNLPLEVIVKEGLMRNAPRGQVSPLMVALLHPLQVVIALMDAF